MKSLKKELAQAVREWAQIDKSAVTFVAPYAWAHQDVHPVPVANIASDLGPKLDRALRRGSRLCVVGYDGATFTKPKYPWRRKISKWLKLGCSVDYFLHAPADGVTRAFSKMTRNLPTGSGRLRLFQPKTNLRRSPSLDHQLAEWKTFHFTVSESPQTLWIEANHQMGKTRAFDCYFFPETAAKETGLAEMYRRRFDRIISKACDRVPISKRKPGDKKPAAS